MTKKEALLFTAKKLLTKDLNVIAVDGHKKAVSAWKDYTVDRISEAALESQIANDRTEGIAIICGAISNNLEVIDFDLKNDVTGKLWVLFLSLLPEELKKKLYIVSTKSGGYHIYLRCEVIGKNTKLASRPATPEEIKETPHVKQVVLIETRGEGGYVVAPPSAGYLVEQENEIPVLSIEERDTLLDTARSFMEEELKPEERARFVSSGTPFVLSPFDDYNNKADGVSLLLRHGWTIVSEDKERIYLRRAGNTTAKTSGNYHKEKKLFYVWTTSTQFYPEKAYSPAAIYATLEHNGDFSEAAKKLIKDGYGTRKTPESVKRALQTPFEKDFKFWDVEETKKGGTKINVSLTKLVDFIHVKGGFTGYKYNDTSENIIVQVKDGFVKEVDLYDIKQFLKNEILELPDTFDGITPNELLEVVYREYLSYLSKGFMDFLAVSKLDFLKDTKDAAYFPFRNGIVEVNKDAVKFHKYGEFNKVIWRSQMIDRDITVIDTDNLDLVNIDYSQFLYKAAGENQSRYEYFISAVGYLLHKYKDPKKSFAVILAEEAENEADGGGTGKGIFVKGIKQLIPTELFDGKQFSPSKSFAFQRVSLDTKLIAIEDARRGFKFEEMYSFITEGLPVEKKNQKEFYIPFADAPKITISTNYVISDEGNHAKRRQRVLEFSNYFSPSRTPFDVFGRMLFEDWDGDEWNRFYNFMFFACQLYLENGIVQAGQTDTNKLKNIKLKYSEDLLLFFQNFAEKEEGNFLLFKEVYADFLKSYEYTPKDYSKDRFSKGMNYIASVLGHKLDTIRKKVDGKTQVAIRVYPSYKMGQYKAA
jgi:hypothetical protein